MKKLTYFFKFCLLTAIFCVLGTNAWAITYDCAIQSLNVVQSDDITKNLFTITITQKGKSRSSAYAWWNTTATIVLESNDRTLEGTYSTANANGNNKINTTDSYVMYGTTKRILQSGTASTFRINKVSEGVYRVMSGYGLHTQNETNSSTKQDYLYCYASAEPSAANPYASSVASVETTYDFNFTPKYATAPTGVTASAVAGTSATVSWTSSESAWKYVCLPSATTLTESHWSSAVSTNSKSATLSGLMPSTRYKFYVISDRGANGTSLITSMEFTTECDVISSFPWNYGFEGTTNDQTPLCWGELKKSGSTSGYVQASTLASRGSSTYGLRIAGGRSNGSPKSEVIAVFPEFSENISNLELKFYYKAEPDVIDDYYGNEIHGKLQLGYVTNPSSAASFVAVGDPLEQRSTFGKVEGINMADAPAGARFAILYTGGEALAYAAIDDITVTAKPSCNKPMGVSVTADSETAEGATITWNANSMSAWKLQVSEGDAASWGSDIAVATNSKVLTGLKAHTLYYVRVKADCGGGSVSDWSDNVSFTTLCGTINVNASTSWNMDFQSLSDNVIPDCWDNTSSTTVSSWGDNYIWGTYSRLGERMLRMDNQYLDGGIALINTPGIAIPNDGNNYELTFDYSNMANSSNLVVKVSENGSAFVQKDSYINDTEHSPATYPGNMNRATISLADYSGKTIKVQFYAQPKSGTNADGAMFVDNVSVHKVPTCFTPTDLTFGNLTATSARASWTPAGEETSWRLQYRSAEGAWSAEQTVNTTPQFNITGLSASTEYFVRVKAYCAAADQSEWSVVGSFTTLCAAASMPFEEHFSSTSGLPSCWLATPASGTYKWGAYENSGAYSVQLRTGSSGEAELRMPAISLSEAAILRFEWKNANGANANIYISTDGGTTKTLIPNDLSAVYADWTTKIFDLSAYTGETVLIYFKSQFTTVNQYAYLDDVEIVARPCDLILNIQASPITGGANISWSGNVKKLQYKTGSNAWSSVTVASGDYAGPKQITGLTPARTYQVRLLPACSEDQEANYTSPIFFVSKATESIPYESNFESETAGEAPFNWSRVSTSEYPQVVYSWDAYSSTGGLVQENCVQFSGVNTQILVLPEFDATLRNLFIRFHYKNRYCTMELGYVANDGITFTAIETLTNQTGYGEFPFEKVLTNISSSAKCLAIRYSNPESNISAKAFIDDVEVGVLTCAQPESLTLSDVTYNSAHFSWSISDLGTETQYQYIIRQWSESEPNWATATLLGENVREVNLTGLTADKNYEFYLRSYCGSSDQSTPLRIEFKTEVRHEIFEDVSSATNNESRLAALVGQKLDVTLNRPLQRNGDYSTISLPFDLSESDLAKTTCPLHGFIIREYMESVVNTEEVNIYLETVSSIEAGKAYFVRYAGDPTDALAPLTFRSVTIARSTPTNETDGSLTLYGLFNPMAVSADDHSTLFVAANNTLCYPNVNGYIKGFRAYLHVAEGGPLHNAIRHGASIRIREEKNLPTNIDQLQQKEAQVIKVLENGHVFIIRNGVKYNVQGQMIH